MEHMMITNEWMAEDYLSIDDIMDMLEDFRTEEKKYFRRIKELEAQLKAKEAE